jgi:hypothetical protein
MHNQPGDRLCLDLIFALHRPPSNQNVTSGYVAVLNANFVETAPALL